MAAPVARPRKRALAATAVAALLLLVLSGCVKLNANFQVDADETLSGSMQILVDPIALEDMGSPDPSGDLDDAVREAQSDPDVPDGVTVDRVEDDDGYIGMGVTFDRVPASDFRNGGGLDGVGVEGIEILQTDGEISFAMANPLTVGMDDADPFGSAGGIPTSARSMFDEAVVSVSFPGKVLTAEGAQMNGTTATWDLRDYDGDTLAATADASSFPWVVVLLAAGVVVFLLLVAGVIIVLLVLRKKTTNHGMAMQGYASAPGLYPQPPHPSGYPGGYPDGLPPQPTSGHPAAPPHPTGGPHPLSSSNRPHATPYPVTQLGFGVPPRHPGPPLQPRSSSSPRVAPGADEDGDPRSPYGESR